MTYISKTAGRKKTGFCLRNDLLEGVKIIALSKEKNINDMIEEAMEHIIEKYSNLLSGVKED